MAIANNDGSIILSTKVDTSGLNKGMSQMEGKASGLTKAFSKLGAAIAAAFAVRKLIQFGKEAINLASDLQEVQNVVDVAFGEMSYKIEEFSKTAIESFGISELTAKRTASTYMAMAKGMGIAEEAGSDMAIALTGLTADMASFYNVSQDVADTAIKSIFTGETESLKQFGIVMTEVNLQEFARQKGITKSISTMTQQEKTMLRYEYVLKQTALAQGDFVRTQDSWANQTRVLQERWKEMQATFGETFIALGTLVLPVINAIIEGLNKIAIAFRVVVESLGLLGNAETSVSTATNEQAENIEQSVENQNDLTKAVEETNKAMKKTTASFDTIEILSAGTAQEAEPIIPEIIGGGSGEEIKETTKELSAFEEKIRAIVAKIKKAFEPLETSLKDIFVPLKDGANDVWNNVLVPFGNWVLNTFAPAFSQTLANGVTMSKDAFVALGEYLETLWNDTLSPIFSGIGDFIIGLINRIGELFAYISEKIGLHKEEIGMLIEFLGGLLQVVWALLKPLLDFALEIRKSVAKIIIDVVFVALSYLGNLYNFVKNIVLGIIELFKGNFDVAGEFFKNAFKSFGNVIISIANLVISLINTMLEAVTGGIKTVINGLAGVVEKIGSWFGKDWDLKIDSVVPKIPQIPKLAQGAVVPPNKEFMAILGDNKKEHEIVSPLSTIEQAVANVLSRQGGTTKEEHYYLNESELMRVVYKLFEGGKHLNGMSLEDGGY